MRRSVTGGAAAGMLPAALLVSVLCSAPFAGTTTAPLAADKEPMPQSATAERAGSGEHRDSPGGGAAALLAAEALLGAVGAGVVFTVARRGSAQPSARP